MEIDYQILVKENIQDFYPYLFPQMRIIFEENGEIKEHINSLYIGASVQGEAVGAISAELEDEGNIEILSLFIKEEWKRRGIGSGLVDALLRVARKSFIWQEEMEQAHVDIKSHYVMQRREIKIWEAFLQHIGIYGYSHLGKVWEIASSDIAKSNNYRSAFCKTYQIGEDIASLTQLPEETYQAMLQDEEIYVEIDTDFSCCKADSQMKICACIYIRRGYGNSIILEHLSAGDDVTNQELIDLYCAVFYKVREKMPEFTLFITDRTVRAKQAVYGMCGGKPVEYEEHTAWGEVVFDR